MNRILLILTLAGLTCAGLAAADESMSASSMTDRQALKDCMEQQKSANMSMSKSQLKRLCKDKHKVQKATGDMPEQPAADAPQSPPAP